MTTTAALVTADAGEWTLAYTAAAPITIAIQNRSKSLDLLVRIGALTTTSDTLDAAAESMHPGEVRSITLAIGDKIHVRPDCAADVVTAQSATAVVRA